jgi:hypothetical protein
MRCAEYPVFQWAKINYLNLMLGMFAIVNSLTFNSFVLEAAPYGGARFPVDARLAGRTFAKFHLDVSTGDVLREPYETLSARDWLGFAGIARAQFLAVSPEEQFEEKLHAYTLPRTGRENTRVKDLVDLVLLIELTGLDVARLPRTVG